MTPKWFDPRRLLTSLRSRAGDFLKNEPVRAEMRKNGDDCMMPRPIEHYAYFQAPEGRAAYREIILSRGYVVLHEDMSASGDGRFFILFSKVEAPIAIDKETALLEDHATVLGGEYDGWETDTLRKLI